MSWKSRYPQEYAAAEHALEAAAGAITANLSTFAGWLMAASGAAFSLLLSNIDKLTPHVELRSFRWALVWFAVSLLAGLLSRWLANSVVSTLAVMASIKARAAETGPIQGFNPLAFTQLLAQAFLPGYRCLAWRGYRRAKLPNAPTPLQSSVRLSQAQSLLVLLQVVFVFVSIVVLAHGVKA